LRRFFFDLLRPWISTSFLGNLSWREWIPWISGPTALKVEKTYIVLKISFKISSGRDRKQGISAEGEAGFPAWPKAGKVAPS
jgi:hypothetical protein